VRNLKKHLEKIYRKVAIKMVRRGDQAPAPPRDMPATTSSVGEPEVADLDFVTATPTPEGANSCPGLHSDPIGTISTSLLKGGEVMTKRLSYQSPQGNISPPPPNYASLLH